MANRTNKKTRDLPNPLQTFIIEQQTKEIEELRYIISTHEAARRIEAERLRQAHARIETLELAHKINTETLSVYVTPVVKVLSDADKAALNRGDFVDVSMPNGTGPL